MKLPFAQLRLAPGARHPHDRQCPERVELDDDERGLEVIGGSMHRLVDGAGRRAASAERIDRPVMIHDASVRILLSDLLELTAAHLVGLDPAAHPAPPGRRPWDSAWK